MDNVTINAETDTQAEIVEKLAKARVTTGAGEMQTLEKIAKPKRVRKPKSAAPAVEAAPEVDSAEQTRQARWNEYLALAANIIREDVTTADVVNANILAAANSPPGRTVRLLKGAEAENLARYYRTTARKARRERDQAARVPTGNKQVARQQRQATHNRTHSSVLPVFEFVDA